MNAGDGDYVTYTRHGFHWGNVKVTRLTHFKGKGRFLGISVDGRSDCKGIEVYVSEGGRSVRVWKNGEEIT